MKQHEDIIVFGKTGVEFYPIKTPCVPYKYVFKNRGKKDHVYSNHDSLNGTSKIYYDKYPSSVIEIPNAKKIANGHPTQKPVALFEYLIKTYSLEGELILDNCAGSGTTAVAAENLGRNWICIEKDAGYCEMARKRVAENRLKLPLFAFAGDTKYERE